MSSKIDHPKYTLTVGSKFGNFTIYEHTSSGDQIYSRPHAVLETLDHAVRKLAEITGEEIVIAVSNTSIDNSFRI